MKIAFNGLPNPTLGVELELQILDRETMNLVGGVLRIPAASNDEHVKQELIESTIELNTNICPNVAAVRLELGERIRALLAACDELGHAVACTGTHPCSKWAEQRITPKDRCHRLVDRYQWPARRLMIFGLHVGVQSGEKAIALFNSMTTFLPHLLALVETLAPVARRLGSHDDLMRVPDMLRVGPSYQRQQRIYEETGQYLDVMRSLAREFRENISVAV